MNLQFRFLPLLFFILIFTAGCHILISEQEWSDNYALLDGTLSTNPEMIDGDFITVGESRSSTGPGNLYGSSNATEVIVTLPEKKLVRKIIIHSEIINKFAIYADRGGTVHSETDWQLVKEIKSVKSSPVVIPYMDIHPTARFRFVILDVKDDATLYRQAKAEYITEIDRLNRQQQNQRYTSDSRRYFRNRYPARISEIEFFGYKSADETKAIKTDPQPKRDTELDIILE